MHVYYYIGIEYPEKSLKKELWSLFKAHKPRSVKYVVDEIANEKGKYHHLVEHIS